MWLLPIIRPLPGSTGGGPSDWIPVVIVVGALAVIAAALVLATNLGLFGTAGRPSEPVHPVRHDRAA